MDKYESQKIERNGEKLDDISNSVTNSSLCNLRNTEARSADITSVFEQVAKIKSYGK